MDYAATENMQVILDPHNYAEYYGVNIGTPGGVPNSAFADLWGKLADHFEDDGHVLFGLMNEPVDQSAEQWLASANAAIDAIRATGAAQEILVPGVGWSSAMDWSLNRNDVVLGPGIRDPLNNFAFEVHQYLDENASGAGSAVSTTIGPERLEAITDWARANNHDLFLGEIGVPSDATSLQALDNSLTFLDQNSDVWEGVTAWAAGPWWGDYHMSLEPSNWSFGQPPSSGEAPIDRPQVDVLERHIDAAPAPTPTPTPTPTPPPPSGPVDPGPVDPGPDSVSFEFDGSFQFGGSFQFSNDEFSIFG